MIERRVVANAGEYIEKFAIAISGIANTVGSDDRQTAFRGQAKQRLVAAFLFAQLMTLKFDIDMAAAVNGCEAIKALAGVTVSILRERSSKRTLFSASEADQAGREFFEIIKSRGTFRLGGFAHLESRNQLAQILVSGLGRTEQRDARRFFRTLVRLPFRRDLTAAVGSDGDLRADVGFDAGLLRRSVKAGDTIEAVAIGESDGRHVEFDGAFD